MATMSAPETPPPGDAWERRRIMASLRIERAGMQLMLERGLDEVTVEQIAREADISVRTFFRYFRNARDILTGVPARESRRMCDALLERPAGESLLDGFHAWFREMAEREIASPRGELEAETFTLWSTVVRAQPEVVQSESNALMVLGADLEEVVRRRMGFGPDDDAKVGVLSAALSAVIWYVYARSLLDGDEGATLSARLDEAFDLLDLLQTGARV
jgi:AcrR family transcriptional regulator